MSPFAPSKPLPRPASMTAAAARCEKSRLDKDPTHKRPKLYFNARASSSSHWVARISDTSCCLLLVKGSFSIYCQSTCESFRTKRVVLEAVQEVESPTLQKSHNLCIVRVHIEDPKLSKLIESTSQPSG